MAEHSKIMISFFDAKECAIEVKAKMFYSWEEDDIAGYFEELSVEDIQEIEKGLLQTVS